MVQQSIEDQDLPTNCWLYVHLSADSGERTRSLFRADVWSAGRVLKPLLAVCNIVLEWIY